MVQIQVRCLEGSRRNQKMDVDNHWPFAWMSISMKVSSLHLAAKWNVIGQEDHEVTIHDLTKWDARLQNTPEKQGSFKDNKRVLICFICKHIFPFHVPRPDSDIFLEPKKTSYCVHWMVSQDMDVSHQYYTINTIQHQQMSDGVQTMCLVFFS